LSSQSKEIVETMHEKISFKKMLLKTNHTLDILPKKESFLLHISIFQIHFFIPPSIFLSFLFNFSLLSFNVTFL